MLEMYLFTDYDFDTGDKANRLFEILNKFDAITHYGSVEPARKAFDVDNVSEPVRLLSGKSKTAGGLTLKSKEYFAWIKWKKNAISQWYFRFNNSFVKKKSSTKTLVEFVTLLSETYPILFAGAADEEEWRAKHLLSTKDKYGTTEEFVGANLDKCLPGIYWLTVMGDTVVDLLGNGIAKLSAPKFEAIGKNAQLLLLSEHPLEPELDERLKLANTIVETLGVENFFDIKKPNKSCKLNLKKKLPSS